MSGHVRMGGEGNAEGVSGGFVVARGRIGGRGLKLGGGGWSTEIIKYAMACVEEVGAGVWEGRVLRGGGRWLLLTFYVYRGRRKS